MQATSVSKQVFMRKYSYENVFPLQVHFQTKFHTNGFAQGLNLKQMHKVTWKWRISKHVPFQTRRQFAAREQASLLQRTS